MGQPQAGQDSGSSLSQVTPITRVLQGEDTAGRAEPCQMPDLTAGGEREAKWRSGQRSEDKPRGTGSCDAEWAKSPRGQQRPGCSAPGSTGARHWSWRGSEGGVGRPALHVARLRALQPPRREGGKQCSCGTGQFLQEFPPLSTTSSEGHHLTKGRPTKESKSVGLLLPGDKGSGMQA